MRARADRDEAPGAMLLPFGAMCGIAGAVDLEGQRHFDPARLRRMARALAHRGPDGEGTHHEPGVALAARRLALVDPVHGAQPFANEREDVWAVCNGEIFDDDAQRAELLARGHVLRSRCDSELWVHSYEEHGVDAVARTNGQFALALWDRRARTLVLARDRFGVRPLYTARADGWLLFASEIKALLASGLITAALDPRGLDYSFTFFAAGAPRTLFAGVESLAPGCLLRVHGRELTHARYWDLRFPPRGEERRVRDERVLLDELDGHLTRAVTRQLRGDAPAACYLSGGLDSSLLLAVATRAQGFAPPAFAIALDGAGPDERAKSRSSAAHVAASLETVVMDRAAIAAEFPALVCAAEEPVVDSSNACLLRLASRVRARGYGVALTGEGADEAFAGYVWYKIARGLRAASPGGFDLLPRALRALTGVLVGGRRRAVGLALAGDRTVQHDIHDALGQARDGLYADSLWDRLGDYAPGDDVALDPESSRWHPQHQAQYLDYKLMLPGHLLAGKGDRVAMAHAVETRYPFLDPDLVDFAAQLAPEYKLRGFSGKWLLRALARRYLPPAIAARPKAMLRADRARALLGAQRPAWVDELLSPASLARTGLFRADTVRRERALQRALPTATPRRWVLDATLTAVVSTQLLHHLYFGGGLCALPRWTPPEPG